MDDKLTFEQIKAEYIEKVKARFSFLWDRYEKADKFFQSEKYREIDNLFKIEKLQNVFQAIQIELEQIGNILSSKEMSDLMDEYNKKVP